MDTDKEKQVKLMQLHSQSIDERAQWVFKVQCQLLFVASTMLAVILAVDNGEKGNLYTTILVYLVVSLNVICILFSGISIYENIVTSNRAVNRSCELLETPPPFLCLGKKRVYYESIGRDKFFVFCEKAAYISFFLYILSLAVYILSK